MAADLLKAYEKGDTSSLVSILEKQAQQAAKAGDVAAFQKSYSQLRSLYKAQSSTSAKATQQQQPAAPVQEAAVKKTRSGLKRVLSQTTAAVSASASAAASPSSSQNVVVALHLLILLCESDLASFHSELESLPSSAVASDAVQWVTQIERSITEGSYQEVRNLLHDTPKPKDCFAPHVALMQQTVRLEMAECAQASYDSLPLLNLTTLLLLKDTKATEAFARERGWRVHDGRVSFPKTQSIQPGSDAQAAASQLDGHSTLDDTTIAAEQLDAKQRLITQTLGYARELESIV